MATFTKKKLSGSTDGMAIKVDGPATGDAVTVHTAVAGTTVGTFDEIWLYAVNTSASSVKLTIEWGTDVAADGNIEVTVLPEAGLVTIIPGLILQNAKVVKAFAGTADVILVTGFVNAITA
jgi:hypothetical protein